MKSGVKELAKNPALHPDPFLQLPKNGAKGYKGQSNAFDQWILHLLLDRLGRPSLAVVLWDGVTVCTAEGSPLFVMSVNDRVALLKLVSDPEFYFGDLYCVGRIEVEGSLVEFFEMVYLALAQHGSPALLQRYQQRRSTNMQLAPHNIHHHYDIGNDFYRSWLDDQMLYTCAYFAKPNMSLEQAQVAKMEHICHKLRLHRDETVVEAGCGWGSLAIHMAREYGVKVRAYNISHEQIAYARQRARTEGLSDRVEFIEEDYRTIQGQCDAFVSVGMLEHVGPEHYRDLGDVIDRCLNKEGRGLLHFIGRNTPAPMNRWIERRIFPGAYPPSISEMMVILEPYGFSILDIENLRLHYAKTLAHWLARYDHASPAACMQYGKVFDRAWRLYLSGAQAAFLTGEMQLFQIIFMRPSCNNIPWTRDYLCPQRSTLSEEKPWTHSMPSL